MVAERKYREKKGFRAVDMQGMYVRGRESPELFGIGLE